MIFSPETYLWFKSFHIVGVVVWFAGLFYLVRLFIYHVEVQTEKEEIRDAFNNQYTLMEKRLANIITTPGMILAVIMASGLLYMQPSYLSQTWMQIKLLFVAFGAPPTLSIIFAIVDFPNCMFFKALEGLQ